MADRSSDRLILDLDGYTPCFDGSYDALCRMPSSEDNQDPEDIANARRIVACWNACLGIGIEEIERLAQARESQIRNHEGATRRRQHKT